TFHYAGPLAARLPLNITCVTHHLFPPAALVRIRGALCPRSSAYPCPLGFGTCGPSLPPGENNLVSVLCLLAASITRPGSSYGYVADEHCGRG
ncbi:hypothetical protein, partial [Polynucleobacter sp. 39-46-10]|uniref:hypothetical protein n=1 Tax=Polynucleobacter sp. 39-46-10 TaxID=1970428 RepID=UPI0025DE8F88